MDHKINQGHRLKATYAALYALGATIPADGISVALLSSTLAKHLDADTFTGLLHELDRRRIVRILVPAAEGAPVLIERGPEYKDGLERVRLASEKRLF
jgi:hypothetical protein